MVELVGPAGGAEDARLHATLAVPLAFDELEVAGVGPTLPRRDQRCQVELLSVAVTVERLS